MNWRQTMGTRRVRLIVSFLELGLTVETKANISGPDEIFGMDRFAVVTIES